MSFFFEELPSNGAKKENSPEDMVQRLMTTRNGIELSRAFMSIKDKSMRRLIVTTVEEIAKQKATTASTRRRVVM